MGFYAKLVTIVCFSKFGMC